MTPTPDLQLPTFDLPPSWVNRARRIDRSACVELLASELWPLIRPSDWQSRRRLDSGLLAHASLTLNAHFLAQLHARRKSHHLVGDHRTSKSNALNLTPRPRRRRLRPRVRHSPPNPNRGPTRSKLLALWGGGETAYDTGSFVHGWKQTLRLERHRLHDRLAQHFLICPCCNRKFLKLFMVLCSPDELQDAELAEGWIKMLDARHQASRIPLAPQIIKFRAALIDRYGMLFRGEADAHGRRLLCRKCLNIRYGEVKRKRRTGGAYMSAAQFARLEP